MLLARVLNFLPVLGIYGRLLSYYWKIFFVEGCHMQKRFLSIALLVSGLVFLPGCKITDWFKEKFGCPQCVAPVAISTDTRTGDKKVSGEAVITLNGRPVITADDFEKSFQLLMQSQQGLMQVIPMMAADQRIQIFQQLAENMAGEQASYQAIKDQGIDKTPEYQENARMIHEAVDRDLAARTFQTELLKKVTITDADAKNYYEKNADKNPYFKRPPFVAGSLSVKAVAVTFDSEKEAQAFASKAKSGDFDTAARDIKKTIKNLGLVTAQTDLDNAVKAKILAVKQTPQVEVVKGLDNKFYVVKMTEKQEPKLVPFDKVKDQVREVMLAERFQDLYTKEIEKLKKQYNITINQDYIKKLAARFEPQQATPQEEQAAPAKPKAA